MNLKTQLVVGAIEAMNLSDENSPNSQAEHEFEIDGRTIVASIKITEIPKEKLYRNRDWLYNEYVNEGKTLKEIASMFNITPMSIHQWLVKLGIPSRPRGRRQ